MSITYLQMVNIANVHFLTISVESFLSVEMSKLTFETRQTDSKNLWNIVSLLKWVWYCNK